MCVGFWTLEHPDYALMLCANRDEFLGRPTANAHWHSFGPIRGPEGADDDEAGDVLSGRDLLAGGTWAGLTRSGRVALLTNITEPARAYASSRGDLTHAFLRPQAPRTTLQAEIDAFLEENRGRAYAGFNLLLLSPSLSPLSPSPSPSSLSATDLESAGEHGPQGLAFEAAFLTNSGGGGTITSRVLSDEERRCGGMSNGVDRHGASEWPKVQHGTRALRTLLDALPAHAAETEVAEQLFALLTWKSEHAPADRSELRNTIEVEPIRVPLPSTPSTPAADNAPSRASSAYYGTRLSTVVLIRRDGSATFIERDVWTLGGGAGGAKRDSGHDRVFRFQIPWEAHAGGTAG